MKIVEMNNVRIQLVNCFDKWSRSLIRMKSMIVKYPGMDQVQQLVASVPDLYSDWSPRICWTAIGYVALPALIKDFQTYTFSYSAGTACIFKRVYLNDLQPYGYLTL